jgi:nucleoside-diphosphate-sugar epimerase
MLALVTGATGFIGSHIADQLFERGIDVRCIVRKSSNLRWLAGKSYQIFEASLNNVDSLISAVNDVDIIIHSAGLVAARSYEEYLSANRDGTLNLINAALYNNKLKRFVYVSSQTAFGPSKSLVRPIDEDSPANPVTAYGKSKLEADRAVMQYKNKLPITIIRPPAVFGPRDTATLSIFKAIKYGLVSYIGLSKKYVSILHSYDVARAVIDSALSSVCEGKAYFISSDEFYSWNKINNVIISAMDKKFAIPVKLPHFAVLAAGWINELFGRFAKKPPVFNYDKAIDFIQKYWICSDARARADFGFQQLMSLENGVIETVKWYENHDWL